MKIRWILDHYTRKRDVNGNRKFMTRFTSTKTGKTLLAEVDHDSNARGILHDAIGGWQLATHETETNLMPQPWDRLKRRECGIIFTGSAAYSPHDWMENELSPAEIVRNLETEEEAE